ncbi:MAG: hypothetical protein U9R28_07935 [Pseudomonadota bacterium]|nr:hypothetical protein [Pseudomonadota bacterium]
MRPLIKSLIFVSTLALIHPAFAEDFKPSSNVTTLMPLLLDNLDTLEVSGTQLDKVRGISRKSFAEVEYINAQYNNLKNELKDETLDGDGSLEHSMKLIEELAALDKKRMTLTIECVFGLKQVLSAEQYDELIALLEFQS